MLGMALLVSTVAMAQADNKVKQRPTKEEITLKRQEKMKEKMAEKLATMDQAQLAKQKKALEARLAKEKDAKKAEYMKLRLEVINSLIK